MDKRINDDLTEGKVPVMVIAYAGEKKQLLFDVDMLKYITSCYLMSQLHHDYIMVTDSCIMLVTHCRAVVAGTPLAGHIENLPRLKEICTQHGMWLHVLG